MHRTIVVLSVALGLVGCGGDDTTLPGTDSGAGTMDAGGLRTDAGGVRVDAETVPETDSGSTGTDAGGTIGTDAARPDTDGAVPMAIGDACGASGGDCSTIHPRASCVDGFGTYGPFPGGYCTLFCGGRDTCPAGSGCAGISASGAFYCLEQCTSPSDCRTSEGYTCMASPFFGPTPGMYCLPPLAACAPMCRADAGL